MAIAQEAGGTYRVATIAQGAGQAYAFHEHRPSGTELTYNAVLELSGVPERRLRSRVFWTLANILSMRQWYTALLPWLVQRPLEDYAASNREDTPRDQWLPLPADADRASGDGGADNTAKVGYQINPDEVQQLLAVVRYLMVCSLQGDGGAAKVDDFFFELRSHLAARRVREMPPGFAEGAAPSACL